MATNWISALKLVPWADVVKNAPFVADSAKKLWKSVAKEEAEPAPAPVETVQTLSPELQALQAMDSRIAFLENKVSTLQQEMVSSAELITALADQNAQLIKTTGELRSKMRLMAGAAGVFAVATVVSLVVLFVR
ncbi:MAG TPA: hypothetical protein VGU61_16360 [Noviherbaspirillum sp.]|jgi:hypothetical protein|uniref:hypothetical protein n=1 Tax=Noviherbaspirillum sp. TaxID=1926288 RepID=UPI002DDD1FAC|nr:hypothetical protein [Noviherbaspirillum sp.]HEV2611841.1 hypothetical protein [Noviherbaspirillum sp.]